MPFLFILPMTRRRWIADEVCGSRAALIGSHAEHLSRVLRARVGQEFDIVAAGEVRRGRVSSLADGRVEFELGDAISTTASLSVTLALSIFKFDRMEWAIEKCTELGASRIVPVIARRTESHLATAAPKRVERWQRIARESAEQSRRSSAPEIRQPIQVKEAVAIAGHCRVILSEAEEEITLRHAVQNCGGDIVLAVGPEGGWTSGELELFCGGGWTAASLGATILRVETAAISALAIVRSEWQEANGNQKDEDSR